MFAYGQTGSGKTFTIQGILERISYDLFNRQTPQMKDADGKSILSIFVTFIQVIGKDTHDLLGG